MPGSFSNCLKSTDLSAPATMANLFSPPFSTRTAQIPIQSSFFISSVTSCEVLFSSSRTIIIPSWDLLLWLIGLIFLGMLFSPFLGQNRNRRQSRRHGAISLLPCRARKYQNRQRQAYAQCF